MQARVESIQALADVRRAIHKFIEAADTALQEAYAEMAHVQTWLETEQEVYWQHQIRKRTEKVREATEAVRAKKMFQRSDGSRPSAVEEEKALALAKARLAEAHAKLEATRRYARVLQKEILEYKGSVQRFTNNVQCELPTAAAHLEAMIQTLQQYVSQGPGEARSTAGTTESAVPGMARPLDPDAEGTAPPAGEASTDTPEQEPNMERPGGAGE